MRKIIRNAIRCNHCGDVIESTYRHEYVQCSCGKVAVDGGHDYLRRSYSGNRDDYTDLSEYEEVEEKKERLRPSSAEGLFLFFGCKSFVCEPLDQRVINGAG